jgi:hypothetical protein
MRDVDWERHVERLTRRHPEVIQELLDASISGRHHMRGHGILGSRGDHPVRPDLVSELHHVDGQITRITHMNLDVCFFNPALILSYAWQTPLVALRKPDTHAIHLRAVRVPAVPDEDRKGEQQGEGGEPGRHIH